jgi:hypothetical protein
MLSEKMGISSMHVFYFLKHRVLHKDANYHCHFIE